LNSKNKKLFVIKNETSEIVGTFFATTLEKLEAYINDNNLYPKTEISIEEFLDEDSEADVVPLVCTERFLWYELKHKHSIHVVK